MITPLVSSAEFQKEKAKGDIVYIGSNAAVPQLDGDSGMTIFAANATDGDDQSDAGQNKTPSEERKTAPDSGKQGFVAPGGGWSSCK